VDCKKLILLQSKVKEITFQRKNNKNYILTQTIAKKNLLRKKIIVLLKSNLKNL